LPLKTPEGSSSIVAPVSESLGTPLVKAIEILEGFENDAPLKI
jgi:hypothetical protein